MSRGLNGGGDALAPASLLTRPRAPDRSSIALLPLLLAVIAFGVILPPPARAASGNDPSMAERVQALIPQLEANIEKGMKDFDAPGLAIGVVVDDKLVYAKGFGVRSKGGGAPVGTRTVFQIGSNAKAFLTATMALMVDRGKLRWDDRVVDLYPDFQLKDPWVTREFRVFDLAAQRSGLPPLVNDMLVMLDFDQDALIRSMRDIEPASSFRTTFAYTNITHLLASRIVAKAAGADDWNIVLHRDLLGPLGMTASSATVDAIEAAPDHRTAIAGRRRARRRRHSPRFSLTRCAGRAASIRPSRTWRAGFACRLGDGVFEGAGSCHP